MSLTKRLMTDETGQSIVASLKALEAANGDFTGLSELEKQICKAFLEARTGKVFRTRFYKYANNSTSAGTKLLDNAGMAIPTPATDTAEGSDVYLKYALFRWQRCNYTRDDSDGFARPTALKGWPGYAETGAVDVGTLRMAFWWNFEVHATYYDITISDSPHPELGLVPWCDAVKIDADGNKTVMPYFIVSSYNSVTASDGLLRSQPGCPAYNQSYNSQVTNYQKKGAGYWGSRASRNTLQMIWLAIKYATKNSQKYFAGCSSYNIQVACALAESNVKRVLVASSQTGFQAGSCISVGDRGSDTTTERQDALLNNIVDRAVVKSVEAVSVNGADYIALNLDIDTAITTTTTCLVSTMPWYSGKTDKVLGQYDGSPVSNTDAKHPYRIGGIEYMNGQAVIAADTVMEFQSDYSKNVYVAERPTKHVANAHTGYKLIGNIPNKGTGEDFWSGDAYINPETGGYYPASIGGGDSVGTGDIVWAGGANTSGLREYYQGGDLSLGSAGGSVFVSAWPDLSSGHWACASCD